MARSPAAAHVFRKRFHFGRTHAAPLEGRGVIADWDVAEGSVTVWTSTQMPFLVRGMLAAQFGLQDTRVRVICPAVGGGFGLKVQLFVEESIIPELSRRLGAPVKWVEDRYEALAASGHAKEVVCELELATDADGRFLALQGHYVGDGGAYLAHPWTGLIDPLCAASFLPGLYDVQNVRYQVDTPFTNKCQSTAYRGVGWTPGQAAREALIDDAARELGIDPLELRLRNTIPDGRPVPLRDGLQLRRRQLRRVDPARRRADRLRRAARAAARAARAGALPRDRLQPLRRAGRLGRRRRRRSGLPGLQIPRRRERRDGARRDGYAHHRPAVQRPGARDDVGAGRGGRARREDRGRQGRPGRHGRHGLCDRQLRQPHGRDRQRRDQARGRRRARQAAGHRRAPVRGGGRRPRARGRPHLGARLARQELDDPRGRDGRVLGRHGPTTSIRR